MTHRIAAATIAILLGLSAAASQAEAEDENFLEIGLLRYFANNTHLYGILVEANKVGFTSCKLVTPSVPAGFACGPSEVTRWGMTFVDLTAEIGTGVGTDWTLTWDEGLASKTVALIDFDSVQESDWLALPAITVPMDGATGVQPNSSIQWEWPVSPDLGEVEASIHSGDVIASFPGPWALECDSGEDLSHPPAPTSWSPPCLSEGEQSALVYNVVAIIDVPDGLTISGDPWVLENDDWLDVAALSASSFSVSPLPVPSLSPFAIAMLCEDVAILWTSKEGRYCPWRSTWRDEVGGSSATSSRPRRSS